jgi:phosphohistidine phosphatase
VRTDRVLHSGKLRAAQTAGILSASVTPGSEPAARNGMGPNDPVGPVLRELEASGRDAMLVGHMPFVGAAANALLGTGTDHPAVAFRPGTLVCLEQDEDQGGWSVAWMLRPELL